MNGTGLMTLELWWRWLEYVSVGLGIGYRQESVRDWLDEDTVGFEPDDLPFGMSVEKSLIQSIFSPSR